MAAATPRLDRCQEFRNRMPPLAPTRSVWVTKVSRQTAVSHWTYGPHVDLGAKCPIPRLGMIQSRRQQRGACCGEQCNFPACPGPVVLQVRRASTLVKPQCSVSLFFQMLRVSSPFLPFKGGIREFEAYLDGCQDEHPSPLLRPS